MKLILKYVFCFLILGSVCGCSLMDTKNKEEKDVETYKIEDKEKEGSDEGSINDMMSFIKDKVVYDNDEIISEFDFAAKEGRSFMVNGEKVYMYRVDKNEETMQKLLNNASAHNRIQTNQNGEMKEYGASVNGSYLLIYDEEADLSALIDRFKEYNNAN